MPERNTCFDQSDSNFQPFSVFTVVNVPTHRSEPIQQVRNNELVNAVNLSINAVPNVTRPELHDQHDMTLVQMSSEEIQHLQNRILLQEIPVTRQATSNTCSQIVFNIPMVQIPSQQTEENPVESNFPKPLSPQQFDTPLATELATTTNGEKEETSPRDIDNDLECPKCDYFRSLNARRTAELKKTEKQNCRLGEGESANRGPQSFTLPRIARFEGQPKDTVGKLI